jgi:hypothetical protein
MNPEPTEYGSRVPTCLRAAKWTRNLPNTDHECQHVSVPQNVPGTYRNGSLVPTCLRAAKWTRNLPNTDHECQQLDGTLCFCLGNVRIIAHYSCPTSSRWMWDKQGGRWWSPPHSRQPSQSCKLMRILRPWFSTKTGVRFVARHEVGRRHVLWEHSHMLVNTCTNMLHIIRRSRWLRCLRHELSSPSRTLGSWVRIQLEAWKFVYVYSVCVVLCR